MKHLKVSPASSVKGAIRVPGDKSVSHRSIMMGSLATGKTRVSNFLASADCLSTARIFKSMGVRIRRKGSDVVIVGRGLRGLTAPKGVLDAGNSGTTSRILLGLLAGQPFACRLDGDKYLRRRPMRRVTGPVRLMGAVFRGRGDASYLPIEVKGGSLRGITYRLPVASAQVKSALLLAGLYAKGATTVIEPMATRDHTERMFSMFGIPYKKKGLRVTVKGPVKPFEGRRVTVPGDISSAAFFIVAALITPSSRLVLKGVGVNPTRTGLLDVLRRMGARIRVARKKAARGGEPLADLVVESSRLKGVTVGGADVPRMIDEFPVLAVAASQAHGVTRVLDAGDLRVKESDRIEAVTAFLVKMGADIRSTRDGWVIRGPRRLKGAAVDSHGDHRIAMSAAVAGLVASGPTVIRDTENIDTSFPGFERLLRKVVKK